MRSLTLAALSLISLPFALILAPTATPLLFGDNGKGRHPVTWVNEYKGGRMFYTSLGVPEDFKDGNFRRMLVNAVYWTTRREAPKSR